MDRPDSHSPVGLAQIAQITLALLFFLCLSDLPYGYYQLVRFLALVGFAFLALEANNRKNETEMWVYIALAVLFQPFFKIALGRMLWNIVDVVVAVGLLWRAWRSRETK